MKVYKYTIVAVLVAFCIALAVMIPFGLGFVRLADADANSLVLNISINVTCNCLLLLVTSTVGYLRERRNSGMNFYFVIKDFLDAVSDYHSDMPLEEKLGLFKKISSKNFLRRTASVHEGIEFLAPGREIEKEIDDIYTHISREERIIRTVVDEVVDENIYKNVKVDYSNMTQEQLFAEFEKLLAQNGEVFQKLLDVYSKVIE